MIPDKIYLPKDEIEERKPWIETTYDPNWDECYIRKDALLEWANVHKTVIETNGEEDDAYTRGQYSVILALIDKLNEM